MHLCQLDWLQGIERQLPDCPFERLAAVRPGEIHLSHGCRYRQEVSRSYRLMGKLPQLTRIDIE